MRQPTVLGSGLPRNWLLVASAPAYDRRMLVTRAIELLDSAHDPQRAAFPVRIRACTGGYAIEHEGPDVARYSINCLLGLQAAGRHGVNHPALAETQARVEAFAARHGRTITRPSDLGLFAAVAVGAGLESQAAESIERVRAITAGPAARRLTMQDLAWIVWGAAAGARIGVTGASELAHSLIDRMLARYVVSATGLPRHSLNPLRAGIVSFGSLAYYLTALHAYWCWSGDRRALDAFAAGVAATLRLQAPDGAWPWLVDCSSGAVLSRYPVYTVHQLSMASFFLLPALRAGILDTSRPVETSVAWVFGANELRRSLCVRRPYLIFRSVQPARPLPRVSRYLAAAPRALLSRSQTRPPTRRLGVDTASHSYEWGWLLAAWSAPRDRALLSAALAGARRRDREPGADYTPLVPVSVSVSTGMDDTTTMPGLQRAGTAEK